MNTDSFNAENYIPQTDDLVTRKSEIVDELVPDYSGDNLVALLMLAGASARQEAKPKQPTSEHRFDINWANKASQRLTNTATRISHYPSNLDSVTYSDIIKNPRKYGLEHKDIPYLEKWVLSENLINTNIEQQYGIMRLDNFRKRIVEQYFKKGTKGTLLALDVVGLKEFNNYSPKYGDQALKKTAERLLTFLGPNGLNCKNPELLIGRKGDEFYVFIPESDVNDISEQFNQHQEKSSDGQVIEVFDKTTNSSEVKPIIHYWRLSGDITQDNFDGTMLLLDESIESAKLELANSTLTQIEASQHEPMAKYATLMRLLLKKRISPNLINTLLRTGIDVFSSYVQITETEASNILNDIQKKFSSQEIQANLDAIMQRLSFQAETPASHIL